MTAMAAVVGAVLVPSAAQASGQYLPGTSGIDISYPSCNTTVPTDIAFGIVGVSGGRVYTDNACARAEADAIATVDGTSTPDMSKVSIYVNTGLVTNGSYFSTAAADYNCGKNRSCGAYYYGFEAGQHAYQYAQTHGLAGVATWWLDVETTNTWSGQDALNIQSIQGEYDAITRLAAGATVGVYARPGQWSKITGTGLSSSGWPVWYATGLQNQTDQQLATYCGKSFTGGPVEIIQWIGPGTLNDRDYACP